VVPFAKCRLFARFCSWRRPLWTSRLHAPITNTHHNRVLLLGGCILGGLHLLGLRRQKDPAPPPLNAWRRFGRPPRTAFSTPIGSSPFPQRGTFPRFMNFSHLATSCFALLDRLVFSPGPPQALEKFLFFPPSYLGVSFSVFSPPLSSK